MLLRYGRRRRFHLEFEITEEEKEKGSIACRYICTNAITEIIHTSWSRLIKHTHTHTHSPSPQRSFTSHECIQVWFPILTSHRKALKPLPLQQHHSSRHHITILHPQLTNPSLQNPSTPHFLISIQHSLLSSMTCTYPNNIAQHTQTPKLHHSSKRSSICTPASKEHTHNDDKRQHQSHRMCQKQRTTSN